MPRLDEYMQINEAASFLGVATNTLRNWGEAGKITEYRHPINNYRLYKRDDLELVLRKLEASAKTTGRSTSPKRPR